MTSTSFSQRHIGPRPDEQGRMLQLLGYDSISAFTPPFGIHPMVVLDLEKQVPKREQRQMVERANARFAALVQNGSDVISVLDGDLNVIYVSPSYTDAFGRRVDAVLDTFRQQGFDHAAVVGQMQAGPAELVVQG